MLIGEGRWGGKIVELDTHGDVRVTFKFTPEEAAGAAVALLAGATKCGWVNAPQAQAERAVELLRQFKDWHDAPHTTTSDTEFATCAGAIDDFLDEIDRDAAQEADPFRKIVPANPRAGADEDADNG
jgi:hypothetical protein